MTPEDLITELTSTWSGTPEEILIQTTGEPLDVEACACASTLVEYLAAVYGRTHNPHTADLIADLVTPPWSWAPPPQRAAETAWRRLASCDDE